MEKTLNSKEILTHRDLSWLAFNERVMEESLDLDNPPVERLKFLCIAANNLDEFFMVRVAGLKRLIDAGFNHKDVFGYYPVELFSEIQSRINCQIEKIYAIYNENVSKDLIRNKVYVLRTRQLDAEQKRVVDEYFKATLFPILTPMAVDPGHPFPVLRSKTNAFALLLNKDDNTHLALLSIPDSVPRLYKVPSEKGEAVFVFIDDIIRENLGMFFRGYTVLDHFSFRIIRDSELSFKEEYESDLLSVIEAEIKKRPRAKVVSLQVSESTHSGLLDLLQTNLNFSKDETVFVNGEVDLSSLCEILTESVKPELTFSSYTPARIEYENIFDRISEGDFLLHLPYQTFYPVVDLVQSAANDDNVLAIKMTLYRTNKNSKIIKALSTAAKNGKHVTAVVELKARFDEEKNIEWTRDLEAAGCHVIYGIPGIKIHSKMVLIVRKEEGKIVRYMHLSTGNYNEQTAQIYTDMGYFTRNEDFAMDIAELFNVITGYSVSERWRRVISSPLDMRGYFIELIDKEIEFQKKYGNGLVFAKMNSLEDAKIIDKLYAASNAGVKVKLIVRGICCLIPGVEDMSKNIEVKSIVGRFLEHSRIFIFNNNSEYRVFLSSADWMSRNFDRRVELMFEVTRQDIKEHLKYIMDVYWKDTKKSHYLLPNREYVKYGNDGKSFNAQEFFMEYYKK